jgi:hypothetical protein
MTGWKHVIFVGKYSLIESNNTSSSGPADVDATRDMGADQKVGLMPPATRQSRRADSIKRELVCAINKYTTGTCGLLVNISDVLLFCLALSHQTLQTNWTIGKVRSDLQTCTTHIQMYTHLNNPTQELVTWILQKVRYLVRGRGHMLTDFVSKYQLAYIASPPVHAFQDAFSSTMEEFEILVCIPSH